MPSLPMSVTPILLLIGSNVLNLAIIAVLLMRQHAEPPRAFKPA